MSDSPDICYLCSKQALSAYEPGWFAWGKARTLCPRCAGKMRKANAARYRKAKGHLERSIEQAKDHHERVRQAIDERLIQRVKSKGWPK